MVSALIVGAVLAQQTPPFARVQPMWVCQAGNPQHTAWSLAYTPHFDRIDWTTKLDLTPRYFGDALLSHYGSICVTQRNTVVAPVKVELDSGFKVQAHIGATGRMLWTEPSDYVMPPHSWTPMFGPCLVRSPKGPAFVDVAYPLGGGRVAFRDADAFKAKVSWTSFYGAQAWNDDPATYTDKVRICTPLTPTPDGAVLFGFKVLGDTPLHLRSGIARVDSKGQAKYAFADDLSGDPDVASVKMNGAIAVTTWTNEGYVVLNTGNFGRGVIVRFDTRTLDVKSRAALTDPKSGNNALVDDDGTAAPVIGQDGDIYVGVLENPFGSNHARGWLLHFDRTLSQVKTPGAFGWDDSPAVVPSFLVPSYHGGSTYLLVCKYNNYAGAGGDGVNKIALLDPKNSETEAVSGITTLKEVATLTGPTPDQDFIGSHPNAVREWCVNSTAVDIRRGSVILNNEDGFLYRWDLKTFAISEQMRLTDGIGEAYTCTVIGADGHIYGVSDATLFAVGGSKTP